MLSETTIPLNEITADNDGKVATVGGGIVDIRQITTKNGQPMAFVKLEDLQGEERELVVFPNAFKDTADVWSKEKILIVTGKINGLDRSGSPMPEAKILVDTARAVDISEAKEYVPVGEKLKLKSVSTKRTNRAVNSTVANANTVRAKKDQAIKPEEKPTPKIKKLYIRLVDSSDLNKLQAIKNYLDSNLGECEAVLVLGEPKQPIKLPMKIEASETLIKKLEEIVGEGGVKLH